MQWIQDPNISNVDNLNNVRREASRHFRNKMKKYLRGKIEELETNHKIKKFRDFSQTLTVFWLHGGMIFLSFLNVHGVSDVRQTAEPLVFEPSAFEVELAIGKAKKTQITRY